VVPEMTGPGLVVKEYPVAHSEALVEASVDLTR